MADKEINSPTIRFKGFTEPWEQRKLGDLGYFKNGMNFSKEAMGIGFPFVNLQNIFGTNVINSLNLEKAMASETQLKDYNLLEGDVLFVRSSVKLEGVGKAAVVLKNLEKTTYSGFIIRFRDESNLDNNFKKFIFGTKPIRNQIMSQATNSANKNISQVVLENLNLWIPKQSEQTAIGNFFQELDQLITLQQRELDLMKEEKRTLLSKMFPKNGENFPEIRFPGFTDAWEQRKLGEVAPLRGGFAFKSEEFMDEGVPIVRISNVLSSGNVGGEFAYYRDLLDDGKFILQGRSILLAMSGATTGKIAVLDSNKRYYQNQRVGYFQKTGKISYDFLISLLHTRKFINQLNSVLVAGAQPNISSKEIDSFTFNFPTLSEQTAIGSFFQELDKLITLQQRELETLKTMKKALLKAMFA